MSEADQKNLFDELQNVSVYELPLTQRIRNFLRFEFLFDHTEFCAERATLWDARQCIHNLIETSDLITRFDVKSDLCLELDRQLNLLNAIKDNPDVNSSALLTIQDQIRSTIENINDSAYHPGHTLRNDELINSVKQRATIPGGACSFDLPGYHFWLNQPDTVKQAQLMCWLGDMRKLQDAIGLTLKLIRNSATITNEIAESGFYSHSLSSQKSIQLIRASLPVEADFFPEISGGRHRFSIRFLKLEKTSERPLQLTENTTFSLQLCH